MKLKLRKLETDSIILYNILKYKITLSLDKNYVAKQLENEKDEDTKIIVKSILFDKNLTEVKKKNRFTGSLNSRIIIDALKLNSSVTHLDLRCNFVKFILIFL